MHPLSKSSVDRRVLMSLLGAGAMASSCSQRVAGYRFKIDFRLVVDGVLKEARTIRSMEWRKQSKWLLAGEGPFSDVDGSAVAIDIDNSRTIILTLGGYYNWNGNRMTSYGKGERKWESGGQWSMEYLYRDRAIELLPIIDGRPTIVPRYDTIFQLAPHELPVLATFNNTASPDTGRVIRPENLTEEFPGVSFGISTVQFTRERVTRSDIGKRLPWLSERYPYESGRRSLDTTLFRA